MKLFASSFSTSSSFSNRSLLLSWLWLGVGEHADDEVHFLGAVAVVERRPALLVADVHVCVQALQDGKGDATVHFHESSRHHVAHDEDEQEEGHRLVDVLLEVGHVGDQHVANSRVQNTDRRLSEEVYEGSDSVGDEEGGGVLQSEDESLHGRGAEVLAGERDLDVGVLVDELDEAVEAVQAAASAIQYAASKGILVLDLLHLLINDLQNETDCPDHGQQERSEGE